MLKRNSGIKSKTKYIYKHNILYTIAEISLPSTLKKEGVKCCNYILLFVCLFVFPCIKPEKMYIILRYTYTQVGVFLWFGALQVNPDCD